MLRMKGFSLVELMIVVAIIGILAAIAIPKFVEMQQRAKRSEVPGNVDGIKTASVGYVVSFDNYLALSAAPRDLALVDKAAVDWVTADANWGLIGWSPDGRVRGAYEGVRVGDDDFVVTGACDVDGDGVSALYTASKTVNVTQNTANDVF